MFWMTTCLFFIWRKYYCY